MRIPISALIGMVMTSAFVLAAIFAPWIAPYPPNIGDLMTTLASHPRFPLAWAQKLQFWANSTAAETQTEATSTTPSKKSGGGKEKKGPSKQASGGSGKSGGGKPSSSGGGDPKGRHVIRHDAVPLVRVSCEIPVALQLDGDHLGERSEVEFLSVPEALRVVV